MKNTFFFSDPHFDHFNIMRYCNRPFKTVDEMGETIIANHNAVVNTNDDVYILGDLAFDKRDPKRTVEKFARRLNGHLHWIFGNHDHQQARAAEGFAWKGEYKKIKVGGHKIILFHYPILGWDCKHYGSIHFHGHVHDGTFHEEMVPEKFKGRCLNTCVDVTGFRPLEFEETLVELRKIKWEPPEFSRSRILPL